MSSLFRKGSKRKRPLVAEGAPEGPSGGGGGGGGGGGEPAPPRRRPPPSPSPPPTATTNSLTTTFADLGLCPPLVSTCRKLGFRRPTAVQRAIVPLVLGSARSLSPGSSSPSEAEGRGRHLLTLSATGSGKTAAFALPLLHLLSSDPYGIFALILTPTRELAKQIQQQISALGSGSGWKIDCALIVGGEDATRQGLELAKQPHFVVATPGRLAELCRDGGGGGGGLYRPNFRKVRFVVLDEADRLLCARSGFERDVAEILLQSTTRVTEDGSGGGKRARRDSCRTLLFSATMTRSLASLEEMAGAGAGRLPLTKVVVREDGTWDQGDLGGADGAETKKRKKKKCDEAEGKGDRSRGDDNGNEESDADKDDDSDESDDAGSTPNVPAGLRQEYIFMPSRVREAYLLCAVRALLTHGGRGKKDGDGGGSGWDGADDGPRDASARRDEDVPPGRDRRRARSAIIFVPTCERCAHVSGILSELGIRNVALHSLLTQNRRLASLGAFQSQRVRVLVATDVASRGLDVPAVDLVINAELPRRAVDYVHRVGRTARAGRRGRAVSLVGERDVELVHQAERISGRKLEKCEEVTDDMAVRLLGPVAKASRLAKMKLMDIGFDELVEKHRRRKKRDRRRREKAEKRARRAAAEAMERRS